MADWTSGPGRDWPGREGPVCGCRSGWNVPALPCPTCLPCLPCPGKSDCCSSLSRSLFFLPFQLFIFYGMVWYGIVLYCTVLYFSVLYNKKYKSSCFFRYFSLRPLLLLVLLLPFMGTYFQYLPTTANSPHACTQHTHIPTHSVPVGSYLCVDVGAGSR